MKFDVKLTTESQVNNFQFWNVENKFGGYLIFTAPFLKNWVHNEKIAELNTCTRETYHRLGCKVIIILCL
jgi:hypothetical protein